MNNGFDDKLKTVAPYEVAKRVVLSRAGREIFSDFLSGTAKFSEAYVIGSNTLVVLNGRLDTCLLLFRKVYEDKELEQFDFCSANVHCAGTEGEPVIKDIKQKTGAFTEHVSSNYTAKSVSRFLDEIYRVEDPFKTVKELAKKIPKDIYAHSKRVERSPPIGGSRSSTHGRRDRREFLAI